MRLLDRLAVYTPERGEAQGCISQHHLFHTRETSLHPLVSIELLAQGAAAHEGYRRLLEGKQIGGGFLAGVREFTIIRAPCIGEKIRTIAERAFSIGELEVVRGEVVCNDECIARGELVFYLNDELRLPVDAPATSPQLAPRDSQLTLSQTLPGCLQSLDREAMQATFVLSPSLPAFSGHFPDFPVLPAVVSMMCAELALTELEGARPDLGFVKNAKFNHPITPGETLEIFSQRSTAQGHSWYRCHLQTSHGRVGRITWGEREGSGSEFCPTGSALPGTGGC